MDRACFYTPRRNTLYTLEEFKYIPGYVRTVAIYSATAFLDIGAKATEAGPPHICVTTQVVRQLAADFGSSFGFRLLAALVCLAKCMHAKWERQS